MAIKVGFMQLSSCWGCHQSLLNLHEELLEILSLINIVYWSAVIDVKEKDLEAIPDRSIDVGFIEGMIRTEEDLKHTKLMRRKSKLIVALGACACFGGIPGLANLYDKEDLLKRKFEEADSITNTKGCPTENVPPIEEWVELVEDFIDVDIFIPGCPPTPHQIKGAIIYLALIPLDAEFPGENICEKCDLRGNGCLLNQEILCFGSITAGPPGIKWTNDKGAVLGEYGPTAKVAEPESKKLINLIVAKFKSPLKEKEISKILEFFILFLKLSLLGYMYSNLDPLQRISTKRHKELSTKKITIENHSLTAFDLNLPKYPTITRDILEVLLFGLSKDPGFKVSQKSVCATCPRNIEEKHLTVIKRDYEGIVNPEDCLLEQGYLCMGPATKAGCGALCPKMGLSCLGCYGPTDNVQDIGAKFINAIASISTELEPEEILEKIVDPAGLIYRFQLPASILHKKVKDRKNEKKNR